jgi:hypothetical protein
MLYHTRFGTFGVSAGSRPSSESPDHDLGAKAALLCTYPRSHARKSTTTLSRPHARRTEVPCKGWLARIPVRIITSTAELEEPRPFLEPVDALCEASE